MRYLILGLLLLFIVPVGVWSQEKRDFQSIPEMNKYIFQNSELEKITKGYFLDYMPRFAPEEKEELIEKLNEDFVDREQLLTFISIMEATDISNLFNTDSLLFPIFNEYYTNNGSRAMLIPIVIGDIDFSYTTPKAYEEVFINHLGDRPFERLDKNQILNKNINIIGAFADTLINNDVHLFWNENTFFTNKDRFIKEVKLIVDDKDYIIRENEHFSLNRLYNEKDPLRNISFSITYSDGTEITKKSKTVFVESEYYDLINYQDNPKSGNPYCDINWNTLGIHGNVFNYQTIAGTVTTGNLGGLVGNHYDLPHLEVTIFWGCDNGEYNKILDKPYIIVGGWGPYTDHSLINNNQGWPSTVFDLYYDFNQNGLIDMLAGAGYDVIIAKFRPPNFRTESNSIQLEKLINCINAEKFKNGSYQENVISGYSAGAMCVRMTLERMENEHLDDTNNPHHHCKLYVSMDGEHGGANVPLGLQHSVTYLKNYHGNPLLPDNFPNFTIYALHYILNAPLSAELLKYFHSKTGVTSNPGQGHSILRTLFLDKLEEYNHPKNTHNPTYPAFTRNISLSNGTSHRTANSHSDSYYPYYIDDSTEEDVVKIFEHKKFPGLNRWEVNLLGKDNEMVFRYEDKPWLFWWNIVYEGVTNNPLLIDNTPGGTTFLVEKDDCNDQNIMYQVLRRMELKTNNLLPASAKADYIDYKAMYTFTPTFFAHDIKNINYHEATGGRRLYYDMREEGLMYQNINEIIDAENASPYFGYPHLAHPTDHYTNYTPFDAVFAWDQENTIHLNSGKAEWVLKDSVNCSASFPDFLNGEKPKHDRWEQRSSNLGEVIKDFVLDEADWLDAYIQNRRYGWNANEDDPNYVYKADIVAKQKIFAGDSVTQRTNFKPVEIRKNADVRFIACETIELKPGFHAQGGSKFLAKIDTEKCSFCGKQGMAPRIEKPILELSSTLNKNDKLDYKESDENKVAISIYPNPAKDKTYLQVEDRASSFEYTVYNIMGNLVLDGIGRGKVELHLPKGVYIVKLKINDSWHTRKLIMY